MDTRRWKSVLVPRDVYDEIVAVAYIEGRTIGGQLRMTFDYWKRQNLSKNDMRVLEEVVEKNREAEVKALKEDEARILRAEIEKATRAI